jgi:acetyltransferase-like isoleucine patch superfamily enzyme
MSNWTLEGPSERLIIHTKENLVDATFNTNGGTITIDPLVFFGHKVMILTGSHDPEEFGHDRAHNWPKYIENHIHIKEGVWVASGAIVIGPCVIGKDSVVAAGSVVLPGEYPDKVILGGNPARIIKTING